MHVSCLFRVSFGVVQKALGFIYIGLFFLFVYLGFFKGLFRLHLGFISGLFRVYIYGLSKIPFLDRLFNVFSRRPPPLPPRKNRQTGIWAWILFVSCG